MKIDMDSGWLDQLIGKKSDIELSTLYEEIIEFTKTGLVPNNSKLYRLNREIEKEKDMQISYFNTTKNAILYEMARRYYNQIHSDCDTSNNRQLEGNKLKLK